MNLSRYIRNHTSMFLFFILVLYIGFFPNNMLHCSTISMVANPKKPINISVGLFVFDITQIDNVNQTFTIDFRLELRWDVAQLDEEKNKNTTSVTQYQINDIWNPEVRFINSRKIEKQLEEIVEINKAGIARIVQRYTGEFSSKLNLKEFPFDEQKLEIIIVSNYGPEYVTFIIDQTLTGKMDEFSIPVKYFFAGFG